MTERERTGDSVTVQAAAQWTPTPMFLMRRACIADATFDWAPGDFVEVGAGNGRLTEWFLERGFRATAFDLGDETRTALRGRLARFGANAWICDDLDDVADGSMDYVFAFEVLEHIEDDEAALSRWARLLKPGGRCLLSVPAHAAKYGPGDRAMGHWRRYEKAGLSELVVRCGLAEVQIRNYGFPLGNASRVASNVFGLAQAPAEQNMTERSIRSGVERPAATRRLSWLFNERVLSPFMHVQRWFAGRDWGEGYVLSARRGS